MDRRNGNLFLWVNLLIYLAAPVFYVGVVQAALCDKLGASATLANLPTVTYFCASFAPVFFAAIIPHHLERRVAVWTAALAAGLVGLVALFLILPLSDGIRIGAVIGQGLILGILTSVNMLYVMQFLGRGTSEAGRARALKLTYSFGPVAAVAGSLLAQYIVQGGIRFLKFPLDFAAIYLIAVPCSAIGAWCCSRFELPHLEDEESPGFLVTLAGAFRRYVASPARVRLFLAYTFWYAAFMALPNLSLFIKQAMGREPAALAGAVTAIQFGSKAVSGFFLGILYLRRGLRAPLIVTVVALGLAAIWGDFVRGYPYLFVFSLVGAGQLGGVYFPNVLLTWSPAETVAQDLAIVGLATVAASPAPALYGFLADHWGFSTTFILGFGFAAAALALVLSLKRGAAEG